MSKTVVPLNIFVETVIFFCGNIFFTGFFDEYSSKELHTSSEIKICCDNIKILIVAFK